MKYVDEFRDPIKAKALLKEINQIADGLAEKLKRPVFIMEGRPMGSDTPYWKRKVDGKSTSPAIIPLCLCQYLQ